MIRLILMKEGGGNQAYDLESGDHLIGRSSKCTVRVKEADVSREHVHLNIDGDRVVIENLGRFGTRLDDAPVPPGGIEVGDGQSIRMGKRTILKVDLHPDLQPLEEAADLTSGRMNVTGSGGALSDGLGRFSETLSPSQPGIAATGSPIRSRDERTQKSGATQGYFAEDDAPSRGTWLQENEEAQSIGGTRAQLTRGVPREVIEEARREIQHREKRRILLVIFMPILVLIGLAVGFQALSTPKEEVVNWPKDGKGNRIENDEPGPLGGKDAGQYDIAYFKSSVSKVTREADQVAILCYFGRDLDVPMWITVKEQRTDVSLGIDTVFEQWIAGLTGEGLISQTTTNENAGSGPEEDSTMSMRVVTRSPETLFIICDGDARGANQIPARYFFFEREHEGQSWSGVAFMFRHGARLVSTIMEIPKSCYGRASNLISPPLRLSEIFIQKNWSGGEGMDSSSPEAALAQIKSDLARDASVEWVGIRKRIFAILQAAVKNADSKHEKQALDLLRELREKEARWFNNQMIRFELAKVEGDREGATRLAQQAQSTFSSPDDWRYREVRSGWRP